MAQLNNFVRYGTVPGSGIYGTIPRSAQMVPRYGTYSARPKNRSCKNPIPKEFWNNEHAESRLALLYVNCYRQAESRLLIIPKFFGPEILEFCPRSNQRKNWNFVRSSPRELRTLIFLGKVMRFAQYTRVFQNSLGFAVRSSSA